MSGPSVRMSQPPYLEIRNDKTMSHLLKVTPWASEGQNNKSKSYKATRLIGGLMRFGKLPKFRTCFVLKASLTEFYIQHTITMHCYYFVTSLGIGYQDQKGIKKK